jgi:hypothetical protein
LKARTIRICTTVNTYGSFRNKAEAGSFGHRGAAFGPIRPRSYGETIPHLAHGSQTRYRFPASLLLAEVDSELSLLSRTSSE